VPASSQSKEVDQTTLSFSLHTSSGTLVELHAQDRATFAEWLDGLLLLRPDALIQTKETADLVQMLTDFGVTTRLLQASGDSHEGTANLNGASVDS
jgi:engulfment/cell motility protein 1